MILIVDDDKHIRTVLRFALEKAGYVCEEAEDGRQALELFVQQSPQLLILDIEMPGMDGTDVCKTIRKSSTVPIIFLSCRDDEIDRILGLELGGDDYMSKPFSPRELVARVKAVLRRLTPPSTDLKTEPTFLKHNRLRLNLEEFQAHWDNTALVLTVTEFAILRTLMGYPNKVFSRNELMSGAYGPLTVVSDRTIDSHMRRLRQKFKKLGGAPIETVHGMGYRLGACGA